DVDVVAAGAFGQVQQFFVPGAVDGPQAAPVELQGQQGLEQLLGVFQVAGEVVVGDIDVLEAGNADVGPDFFDHFVQGPPAVGVPVNDGNLAKGAVIGTAAGGLGGDDFHPVAPEIHQFQAGPGQARQLVQPLGLVTPLEAFAAGVLQDLLPDVLRLSHHHRLAVLQGLLRVQGDVEAAHHYRHPAPAELRGDFVSTLRSGASGGDAHQVILAVVGNLHQAVIGQIYHDPPGGEACQIRQGNPQQPAPATAQDSPVRIFGGRLNQ